MAGLRNRGLAAAFLIGLCAVPGAAWADVAGGTLADGAKLSVMLDSSALSNLAMGKGIGGVSDPRRYEYTSVTNCPTSVPGGAGADNFCQAAAAACAGNSPPQGLGPSVKVFRRVAGSAGIAAGPWVQVGITCFPELVPGKQTLGMAQVVAAFHDTRFAVPALWIQPTGNVTLVNLPTYFELAWLPGGFQPGRVDHPDPARLLGYRVEIRPLLRDVTYVYGDGQVEGPTTHTGGPFPNGDVRHDYVRPGDVVVRVDVTYGGQFRVAGGPWIDIPAQVHVSGSTQTLHVATASARLYSSRP
jgi:hypothetical protein